MYNLSGDEMSIFAQRLRDLRLQKGLKQSEIAEKLNISFKTLSAYETGRAQPSMDMLERIAAFFNVSVDYLLGLSDLPKESVKLDLRYIPVYNGVCAGNAGVYPEGSVVIDHIPIPEHSKGKFGVRVYGDSMEPEIHDGDYVVVDPEVQYNNGDKIVVVLEDPFPCAFVKVYKPQDHWDFFLKGDISNE